MINTHTNATINEVLTEAAYRIRAALWIIDQRIQDPAPERLDIGGYDYEIAREALNDVVAELDSAARSTELKVRPRLDPEAVKRAMEAADEAYGLLTLKEIEEAL